MPFRISINHNSKIPIKIYKERSRIYMTARRIYTSPNTHLINAERASAFTSVKGSITVEASIAVPFFFFAMMCLLYLMEIMAIQTAMRSGLQYAGKIVATKCYPVAVVSSSEVKADVVNAIGAERLERSIVEGGSSGVDCRDSKLSPITGIGQLSVKYKIRVPIPMFHIAVIPCEETMRIKAWTGYERSGFGTVEDTIVYVTETGFVYHKDYHCTYLDLSIHMVPAEEVGGLRNNNGGKYHACERCGGSGSTGVYITDTGDRYHSSLTCSGLKRTVYAVPVSEAVGKRPCSKCGG